MRVANLIILSLLFPVFAYAQTATLVNINTDSVASLDGLPYITPKTAQAIFDYRKDNPFVVKEDIMKVTGVKEGIFAHIQSLITVGDLSTSNTLDTSDSTSSDTADTTKNTVTTTYIPPLSTIIVDAGSNNLDTTMDVPLHFSARVTTKSGAIDPSARILWSFGDGSSAEGGTVEKAYRYAGTYVVVVTAVDEQAMGRDEIIVTVRPAQVRVIGITDVGIMISNDASERLDISDCVLFADSGSFRIPNGTVILPKENIILPSSVTNLRTAVNVSLVYPDGVIAARFFPLVPQQITPEEKLYSPKASTNKIQMVEPIISTTADAQVYDETVSTPAVANELAAAGEVLSSDTEANTSSDSSRFNGIFHSPWTLGFLSIVALAGGIFIFI